MIPLCELEDETVWISVGLSLETWRQLCECAERLNETTDGEGLHASELAAVILERVALRIAGGDCQAEGDADDDPEVEFDDDPVTCH